MLSKRMTHFMSLCFIFILWLIFILMLYNVYVSFCTKHIHKSETIDLLGFKKWQIMNVCEFPKWLEFSFVNLIASSDIKMFSARTIYDCKVNTIYAAILINISYKRMESNLYWKIFLTKAFNYFSFEFFTTVKSKIPFTI